MIGQWPKIFLITLAFTSPALATFQADNAADLQLLCTAVALDGAEPSKLTTAAADDAAIKHARALNMSVADKAWQEIFAGGKSKNNWAAKTKKETAEPFKSHWETSYDQWVEDKETVDSGSGESKWLTLNPRPASAAAIQAAAEQINATLNQLLEEPTELEKQRAAATVTHPNKAKAELLQALYDSSVTEAKFATGKTIQDGATYSNGCAANAGLSIYGDIMCICGRQGAGNSDQCDTSNIAFKWNSANDQSVIDSIKTKCKSFQMKTYTAANLEDIKQRILARIKYDKTAGNALVACLGKTSSGLCNGNSGQSCAQYTFDAAEHAASTGGLKIPWLRHLAAAASALRQAEDSARRTTQIADKIKFLTNAISAAHTAKRYENRAIQEDTDKTKQNQGHTTEQNEKQKQCGQNTNKTAEECTKLGCDYDAENKKCKPKPGAENTGAGGGEKKEGATATGVNCSSHSTKEACEKENEGQKPGEKAKCSWIEDKCKDSSILLNKHFALSMVSAAFVTLLF
uniref:Variant surface glycoprotein n=1 Tax=Trypanosoma brucei TaxID=5691 RepID=A0A1V0FZ43_9TRYP|nr:variant surface glycoprotein [Trypanosoma brucei]